MRALSEGFVQVSCGGKRIGVHPYCYITPISALKTPDRVTSRIPAVVSWESSKPLHQKCYNLPFLFPPHCLIPPCYLVTLSPCHLVTPPPCHLVTLSPQHYVILLPYLSNVLISSLSSSHPCPRLIFFLTATSVSLISVSS